MTLRPATNVLSSLPGSRRVQEPEVERRLAALFAGLPQDACELADGPGVLGALGDAYTGRLRHRRANVQPKTGAEGSEPAQLALKGALFED
jgi:hypothetical protein